MNKIQNISFSVKSYTTPGNIHPSLQHVLSVYFDKNIHPCEYSLIINYDSLDHVEIEQLKFIKIIKDKNSKGDNTFPNISIIEVGLNVKNKIKPK